MAKKVPLNLTRQEIINLQRLRLIEHKLRKSNRLEEFCVDPDLLNCGWSCVIPTPKNPNPEKPAIMQVYFYPQTPDQTMDSFYKFLKTLEPRLLPFTNPNFENTSDYLLRSYRLQKFEE